MSSFNQKPLSTRQGLGLTLTPFREGGIKIVLGGRPGFPLIRITVAGQRRTSTCAAVRQHVIVTGFAFTPSHPGDWAPRGRNYLVCFKDFNRHPCKIKGFHPIQPMSLRQKGASVV